MSILQNHYEEIWDTIKDYFINNNYYDDYIIGLFFNDTYIASIKDNVITVVCKMFITKAMMDEEKDKFSSYINDLLKPQTPYTINPIFEDDYLKNNQNEYELDKINDTWVDGISPNFTFDNFVVGPKNKQAQAAAVGCAYKPGGYYNPLFIYGDSGLGKTHLLHAIGNYVKKDHPDYKVLYLPTGDLISQYIDSTRNGNTTQDLMNKLKSVDVLLLDDVQFLASKEKTSNFFFQIYNSLVNNRKQIILTSDTSPYDMNNIDIEERLVSRFASGLTVTIDEPEFETRLEILKMKVKEQSFVNNPILDEDDLVYIAANSTGDVRKMEGLLNQLIFYQIQSNDLDNKDVLKEILQQNINTTNLDANKIIKSVSDYYHITKQQILSKSRSQNIVTARHMAMYLCRTKLDEPFNKIGNYFNNCDHTTVMSACTKIENKIKIDPIYQEAIKKIEERLT